MMRASTFLVLLAWLTLVPHVDRETAFLVAAALAIGAVIGYLEERKFDRARKSKGRDHQDEQP